MDDLRLLTTDDVADLFQVKKSWIYDWVESGDMPCLRLGRHLRFRRSELEAWLEGQHQSSAVRP